MKQTIWRAVAVVLVLAACAQPTAAPPTVEVPVSPSPQVVTLTAAPTRPAELTATVLAPTETIPAPTGTRGLTPTRRPTVTPTPSSTRVQIPVSTFDAANAITHTPAAPAQCPAESPAAAGVDEALSLLIHKESVPSHESQAYEKQLEAAWLQALNAGGLGQLRAGLEAAQVTAGRYAHDDVTNDSVPELLIVHSNWPGNLYVFGCAGGRFETLLVEHSFGETFPAIVAIQDMNLDGVKELVIEHATCHWCLGVRVYEWDGSALQSLARSWTFFYGDNEPHVWDWVELNGIAFPRIEDVDGNGTYELILEGGIPSYMAGTFGDEGPWRQQTVVYEWDGTYFVWNSQRYALPVFRFEAVQDGDSAVRQGDLDYALEMYQAAIFSDTLKSWTQDVWAQLANDNLDYPDVGLMPFNQTEYDQLAAYSRYRIALLHLACEWESDAQTVYDTLQSMYPEGTAGYPYAEMAAEFWAEYQSSGDLVLACDQAIEYAAAHVEILAPMDGMIFGLWDADYEPDDVCPFRDAVP